MGSSDNTYIFNDHSNKLKQNTSLTDTNALFTDLNNFLT